jgi:hypothetical protein
MEIRYFREAQSGRCPAVARYWEDIRKDCERIQREWIECELPKIKPEQVDPAKCASQVWKLIEEEIIRQSKRH